MSCSPGTTFTHLDYKKEHNNFFQKENLPKGVCLFCEVVSELLASVACSQKQTCKVNVRCDQSLTCILTCRDAVNLIA